MFKFKSRKLTCFTPNQSVLVRSVSFFFIFFLFFDFEYLFLRLSDHMNTITNTQSKTIRRKRSQGARNEQKKNSDTSHGRINEYTNIRYHRGDMPLQKRKQK